VTYENLLGAERAAGRWARSPSPHALLRLFGPDTVDFLQRLCSQHVVAMAPGDALPAAFLNPKGKLVATCWLGRTPDAVWLEVARDQLDTLAELLDRYHFAEKLAIERVADWTCGEVLGSGAPAALGLEPGICRPLDGEGLVLTGERHGLSWVRYHAPAAFFEAPPWSEAGLEEISEELAECLRICAGIVAVGSDTEPTTLALEAALDDHVHNDKGCYTGQEIVARIHTYGHVNRLLCLLRVEGTPAIEIGTPLVETEEGDPVGRAMTSAPLPDGNGTVALGYLPGDFQEPGTRLRLGVADGPEVEVVGFGG